MILIIINKITAWNIVNVSELNIVILYTLSTDQLFVFYFFQSRAMIFLLICTAIFMYYRNRIIGLVSVLISFFILYIANFITTWLATISYNLIESDLLFNLLYILFFAFTTLGFSFISRYFVKKLLSSDLSW